MMTGHERRRNKTRLSPVQILTLGLALCALLISTPQAIAEDAPEPPVTNEKPPTDPPPPPTDPPPPPTEAPPPPTEPPPPPTEAPPPPTEIPVYPTEAPVDPTEIAVDPTEEPLDPTEEPTEEPTATPTPTPTPEPAIPFDPVMDCRLIEAGALPVAGGTTWSFQDCTATWETEQVSAVQAQAWSDAAGWQVILINARDLPNKDVRQINAPENQNVLNASDGMLDLTDSNLEDDGFYSSRFYVGTQLGCTSLTSAQVKIDLTATSTAPVSEDESGNPLPIITEDGEEIPAPPGETVKETAQLRNLVFSGTETTAPTVTIVAASFTPIDILEGNMSSIGKLEVHYSNAPKSCAWQLTLAYGDLTNGEVIIPTADLELLDVTGIESSAMSLDNQSFTIYQPGSAETVSGSFTLTTLLELPDPVPAGDYTTSVTVSAIVMP